MVIYIAFIASLNLCVGYALGVYFGVLPGIVPRRRYEEDDAVPPFEPLAAQVQRPPPPASVAATKRASPLRTAAEAASPSQPVTSEILTNLASFREQLASVGNGLRNAGDDRGVIDACASDLKQAGDDYLEKTHEVLDTIDAQESTAAGAAIKETLIEQTGSVEKTTVEIDEILRGEDTTKVRERLLASTEELEESAAEAVQAIPAEQPSNADRPASLVSLDELLQAIDDHLAHASGAPLLQVASIFFNEDRPDGRPLDHPEQLIDALSRIVAQALEDDQRAAIDDRGRLLVLLAGDDESGANARCERARQQVAAATFRGATEALRATVSCAVADTVGLKKRQELLDQLEETIDEALRYGESRTFHHDGRFPAPVVPQKLKVEPLVVEV